MENDVKDTDYLKNLGSILEDYAQWFGDIVILISYPNEDSVAVKTPSSFDGWHKKAEESDSVNSNVLRSLTEAYEHMVMEGRAINKVLEGGEKIEFDVFKSFKDRYESFFRQIRRLERDSAIEESGVDEQTGLRAAKAIEGDMKRELERLDRQGTSFCQVMLRIDGFARLDDHDEALDIAVNNIRTTIRPFDDAYYLGNGHFLISMKQADLIGAEAGINRIRIQLAQDKKNTIPLTISFCIMEPVMGDTVDRMLKNMRQDLNEHLNEKDAVLKFKEISELERFIGNMN